VGGSSYTAFPQGKSQITVLKMTIPVHTTTDWHTHPMLNVTYTVAGELIVEEQKGSDKQEFNARQLCPRLWTPCTTA
jgi:quercetin dioxygenase-like cupin family protein